MVHDHRMPTFTAPDGTKLAYHVEGPGTGEPLVCLPGGAMHASAYLGDLGGLARRRRVARLDLRGTGDSAIPDDPATYAGDRQIPDVDAFRDHLELKRFDLLVHSAAGDLGILYAAQHPDRVRTLTLVAPMARSLGIQVTEEDRREAAALRVGEPWYPAAARSLEAIFAGSGTAADWTAVEPFGYGRWDEVAQAHAAAGSQDQNEEAGEVFRATTYDPDATRAALRGLSARVLIITGELDSGPRPRGAAAIAEAFTQVEVVVQPGAGHFPWLDDPMWFTGIVAPFIG
jgi:pimeloyl-ACP methyl ester carboxylesterase